MATQNMNQFKQSTVVGELDLQTSANPAVFTVLLSPESATTGMVPGEGVKLVDLGASDFRGINPIVDVRALDADAIFGVKVFNTKKNSNVAGEVIQIAGKGAAIWLNAGAAILRGASVDLVLATPGNVVMADGATVLGVALDKATAADQLIRVLIQ